MPGRFRAALPDLRWDLEDLIAEEEKVVARWRMEAINEGEFMGIATTGKRVSVSGINIYCIANYQVVEH